MTFNEHQAETEGWGLFDVDGRLQLQRIDYPDEGDSAPEFDSDAHAIVWVARQAEYGSQYHMDALHLIGTLSGDTNFINIGEST